MERTKSCTCFGRFHLCAIQLLDGLGLTHDRRLKLKVYRSLGIDVEPDPVSGAYTKACVVNRQKGDAHVVSIEPGKFSRFFYAGWFWKIL